MKNKVYVIRYEDLCNEKDYSSGTSYVFDTLEKAENMLKIIKRDEEQSYFDTDEEVEDLVHDLITENGFIIDLGDNYTKYVIEEMELL